MIVTYIMPDGLTSYKRQYYMGCVIPVTGDEVLMESGWLRVLRREVEDILTSEGTVAQQSMTIYLEDA